ncbi:MAG: hypothetical protein KBB55_01910 [Candidatus Buchananbacteria bacterium]|nr:hypothetical protein [Candidatus Buchananbacteria bacterium]
MQQGSEAAVTFVPTGRTPDFYILDDDGVYGFRILEDPKYPDQENLLVVEIIGQVVYARGGKAIPDERFELIAYEPNADTCILARAGGDMLDVVPVAGFMEYDQALAAAQNVEWRRSNPGWQQATTTTMEFITRVLEQDAEHRTE